MAKKSKVSKAEQYRDIVESEGAKWEECVVLCFAFKYQMEVELFHYGLMFEKPSYYVFDYLEGRANVVAPKDEKNIAKIAAIAEGVGGRRTTPEL